MSCKTCFSCFSCFLWFSYLKNERKIFSNFELLLQISRLWTPPVSMISLCVDQAAMHTAKPFFQKRAFSFIYLAKTEGLWSRKVKTLSGTKAPPLY